MSLEERKHIILKEAFKQFSEKGVHATKVDDIASSASVSKKSIYSLFQSKQKLLEEACRWKLSGISGKAQEVVGLDVNLIEKFIKYLEIVVEDVTDISIKMTEEVLEDRDQVIEIVNEYLKGAVYMRFSKLIEQGKAEKWINEETDVAANLIIYWETLSTFLFGRSGRHIPEEFQIKKPVYILFGDQMVNFFRGLLNEQGIRAFNQRLKEHADLSVIFS